MRCRRRIHSCLLQSAAIIVVTTAAVGSAKAQAANTTGANVNALNLLAPFLTLNATPVGKATLQQSLQTVIAINNGATPAAAADCGQRCTEPDERSFEQDHATGQ